MDTLIVQGIAGFVDLLKTIVAPRLSLKQPRLLLASALAPSALDDETEQQRRQSIYGTNLTPEEASEKPEIVISMRQLTDSH